MSIFIILCWGIWNSRNKKFHENIDLLPAQVIRLSNNILDDFRRANAPDQNGSDFCSSPSSSIIWKPPPLGLVKINSDSSWIESNLKAGLGVVCRDHYGSVLAAGAKPLPMVASVLETEARAVLFAVELALQNGFPRCLFEMDSLILARALSENTVIHSIANVLGAIRNAASSGISCEWSFVRRDGNCVAHELAAWAVRENIFRFFVDVLPGGVEQAVVSDLSLI